MMYLNRTSLEGKNKLKGNRNTIWDEVSGVYIREGVVKKNHPETIGGGKEDKYVEAARD